MRGIVRTSQHSIKNHGTPINISKGHIIKGGYGNYSDGRHGVNKEAWRNIYKKFGDVFWEMYLYDKFIKRGGGNDTKGNDRGIHRKGI
jgi:hypothetical protein